MENENNQAAPSVTVDTPEFRELLEWILAMGYRVDDEDAQPNIRGLIAHINAWQRAVTAQAVADERERAARLALQWSNARTPDSGGYALRNYAQALRDGVQVDERDTDYHWSKAPAAAQPIAGELPTLPKPDYTAPRSPLPNSPLRHYWREDAIRTYGHQCRAAALEEAAKLFITPSYAAAIRALNKTGAA